MSWAPDYATVAQLRSYLRITDTADDTVVLEPAITAASRAIDRACSRQFGSVTAAARYYTPSWSTKRQHHIVSVDDFQTTTSLVLKTDTDRDGVYETTITDYLKRPANAAEDGLPWTDIEFFETVPTAMDSLEVTAVWGWTAVPDSIYTACLLQASRIVKRRDAPFGVAGSPDMGNELRLLAKLDPDVAVMVSSFRRYW